MYLSLLDHKVRVRARTTVKYVGNTTYLNLLWCVEDLAVRILASESMVEGSKFPTFYACK